MFILSIMCWALSGILIFIWCGLNRWFGKPAIKCAVAAVILFVLGGVFFITGVLMAA
jgi:hypothetical protein